jgi:hypothetical protein
MISRRSFLSKSGGVLFVGCTCGGFAPVAAQTGKPRREMKVDGKRVKFIAISMRIALCRPSLM